MYLEPQLGVSTGISRRSFNIKKL